MAARSPANVLVGLNLVVLYGSSYVYMQVRNFGDFNLAVAQAVHQSAKCNSLLNFPAIGIIYVGIDVYIVVLH